MQFSASRPRASSSEDAVAATARGAGPTHNSSNSGVTVTPPPPPPRTAVDYVIGTMLRSGEWRVAVDEQTMRPYYWCVREPGRAVWDLAELVRAGSSPPAAASPSPVAPVPPVRDQGTAAAAAVPVRSAAGDFQRRHLPRAAPGSSHGGHNTGVCPPAGGSDAAFSPPPRRPTEGGASAAALSPPPRRPDGQPGQAQPAAAPAAAATGRHHGGASSTQMAALESKLHDLEATARRFRDAAPSTSPQRRAVSPGPSSMPATDTLLQRSLGAASAPPLAASSPARTSGRALQQPLSPEPQRNGGADVFGLRSNDSGATPFAAQRATASPARTAVAPAVVPSRVATRSPRRAVTPTAATGTAGHNTSIGSTGTATTSSSLFAASTASSSAYMRLGSSTTSTRPLFQQQLHTKAELEPRSWKAELQRRQAELATKRDRLRQEREARRQRRLERCFSLSEPSDGRVVRSRSSTESRGRTSPRSPTSPTMRRGSPPARGSPTRRSPYARFASRRTPSL